MLLSDDQWVLIKGIILENRSISNRHKTIPERERFILECILWKLATGIPWYDLPSKILKQNFLSTIMADKNHFENNSLDIVDFFSEN